MSTTTNKETRRRALIAATASLTALAFVAGAGATWFGARAVEGRIRDALAERGFEASWESASIAWNGQIELRDVRASRRGLDLQVKTIGAYPDLGAALSGRARLASLSISGVRGSVDLATLRSGERAVGASEAMAGAAPWARLLGDLPSISIEDAELSLRRKNTALMRARVASAHLKGSHERIEIESEGELALKARGLPAALRRPIPWRANARLEAERAQIALRGVDDRAIIARSWPGLGSASIGELALAWDRGQPGWQIALIGVEASAEQGARPVATLRVGEARVGTKGGEPASVRLEQLDLVVSAGALAWGLDAAERLRAIARAGKVLGAVRRDPRRAFSARGRPERGAIGELLRAVRAIELEVRGGSLSWLEAQGDRIEIAHKVRASSARGLVRAQARAAGGAIELEAGLGPRGRPLYLSATARDIDLENLKRFARLRREPQRGVRGEFGGVLDLSARAIALPERAGAEAWRGDLSASWRRGVLDLDGLADEPLTDLEASVKAEVLWSPAHGLLRFDDGRARFGELSARWRAELTDWGLAPRLRAEAELEEARCAAMLAAIPAPLLGPYRRAEVRGMAAPRLAIDWPLDRPQRFELAFSGMRSHDPPFDWVCAIENLRAPRAAWPAIRVAQRPGSPNQAPPKLLPPPSRHPGAKGDVYWLNKPFIKRVSEGVDAELVVEVGPGLKSYVPLAELPRWVGAAAYLSEEIDFYENRGVSPGLIQKALRIDLERGRFVYGGSTVTQQLVKNLFLVRDKTLARKLQEAIVALRVDEVVSKDRVLELYLNCIEFGPNLYGIGPAARHYFDKDARDLTPTEAIFLANIKPSPRLGERIKRRGQLPGPQSWFVKRFETIFARMIEAGAVSPKQAEDAKPYELRWDESGRYLPRAEGAPAWTPGALLDLFGAGRDEDARGGE